MNTSAVAAGPKWEPGEVLRAAAELNPNMVVILADDIGFGSVAAYGADPKLILTPNLDRLARED